MNKKLQSKIPLLLKIKKSARYNIILNGVIGLLIIIIILITFSLILKLQNLNGSEKFNNSISKVSKPIQVEVLNGCGLPGAADKVTNYLRSKNYDVVQIGNYKSFDIDETMVIDRRGNFKIAEDIADSLGLKKGSVIQQINKKYLLDASIIVGKDYKHLKYKN